MKLLFVPLLLLLVACSSTPPKPVAGPDNQITQHAPNSRQGQLQQYSQSWQGTPYRYGGLSKRGIDCSGLVYVTYRELFDTTLPRETSGQIKSGHKILSSQLTAGDLVFFSTGNKQRHSGIYIGQGRFLHASSSKGVIISRLDNPYWKSSYQQSRRVL